MTEAELLEKLAPLRKKLFDVQRERETQPFLNKIS